VTGGPAAARAGAAACRSWPAERGVDVAGHVVELAAEGVDPRGPPAAQPYFSLVLFPSITVDQAPASPCISHFMV
jgi:hypothetical protein